MIRRSIGARSEVKSRRLYGDEALLEHRLVLVSFKCASVRHVDEDAVGGDNAYAGQGADAGSTTLEGEGFTSAAYAFCDRRVLEGLQSWILKGIVWVVLFEMVGNVRLRLCWRSRSMRANVDSDVNAKERFQGVEPHLAANWMRE